MESLSFIYQGGLRPNTRPDFAVSGVVGSGNLEIMVEPIEGDGCAIEITTAAMGFGKIWQAVMDDFFERHRPGGVRLSINDAGATPAIVSLRLDQAWEAFTRGQT